MKIWSRWNAHTSRPKLKEKRKKVWFFSFSLPSTKLHFFSCKTRTAINLYFLVNHQLVRSWGKQGELIDSGLADSLTPQSRFNFNQILDMAYYIFFCFSHAKRSSSYTIIFFFNMPTSSFFKSMCSNTKLFTSFLYKLFYIMKFN